MITFQAQITEYDVKAHRDYEYAEFILNENSLSISYFNKNKRLLNQTEISREDAQTLAKLIQL